MFAWLKLHPPTEQEMDMNDRLHAKLGWSNLLLSRDKDTRDSFLEDAAFQRAVFPRSEHPAPARTSGKTLPRACATYCLHHTRTSSR